MGSTGRHRPAIQRAGAVHLGHVHITGLGRTQPPPSVRDRGATPRYRQEAPQKAAVTAVFDDGTESRLVFYSSDATGSDNAGKDVQNTAVTRQFAVPAGARAVTLKFRMYDAGNNWFWAVDHIRLGTGPITA
ncbi:hypothetical protein [Streptomyces sp. CB01881]|uniref:hypothetical protein n=1 Tax=Streptomyces sp. CB01881 TaxID=2078691 RepID=UPI000CDCD160|nr:hypothetical protein [Streptomyces sp. CB01881]AUY47956.1 hypothetical protein C2142_02090 [Streptomyces sp. CB01881]TYC76433.1 hypothetical protein EH183_02090 [Streptomyces sp. CB01881]